MNGNLQVTEPRGLTAADVASALNFLYGEYVALPQGSARPINYQSIAPFTSRQRLWTAFEKRNLVRPGRVTRELVLRGKHAPWTFDLGYRNGKLRVISSLALNALAAETNLGRALVFKGMLDDVKAKGEQRDLAGTAVIDWGRDEARAPAGAEARSILQDARIEIVRINEIGKLADRVQAEFSA
jgi:hypothetical protein